jgi:hypothetical protein
MKPEDFHKLSKDGRYRKTRSSRANLEALVIGLISLVTLYLLLQASIEYAGW